MSMLFITATLEQLLSYVYVIYYQNITTIINICLCYLLVQPYNNY